MMRVGNSTVLLVLSLPTILGASPQERSENDAKVIASLEGLGARVTLAGKRLNQRVIAIDFGRVWSPVTDRTLAQIKFMRNLGSLNLEDTQITDEGLRELQGMSHLARLNLSDTKITDAGLNNIVRARRITLELDAIAKGVSPRIRCRSAG